MSELDALPPELRDLIAAERAAPVTHSASLVAVRAKLAATVGKAPLGHAAAGAALTATGKALVAVALSLAAGAGTVAAVKHGTSPRPPVPPPVHVVSMASAPLVIDPSVQPAVVPSEPAPAIPSLQPRSMKRPVIDTRLPRPAPSITAAPVPSQPELLRQAWSMISLGEAQHALELAHQDEQLHRDGPLTEEREALEITALAKLHRTDEARAAADHFFDEHPGSVHRGLIERSLEAKESP